MSIMDWKAAAAAIDVLAFLAFFALALLVHARVSKRSIFPYPPGPKRLPILGNLFQLPTNGFEWKAYDRMCKELGTDIMYLRVPGQDIIVLNSLDAVNDLLDKRSLINSDRPRFTMLDHLMGWGWMYSMMNYGSPWRERRRVFTKYFQMKHSSSVYQLQQKTHIRRMLPDLLNRPDEYVEITMGAISGSALSIAYGISTKKRHDPYVEIAEKAMSSLNDALTPGKYMVNLFPIFRYIPEFLPGGGFKTTAKQGKHYQEDFHTVPFERTKRDMAEGTAQPSFSKTLLEQSINLDPKHTSELQEVLIKDSAGVIFAGSVETLFSALTTFYAAMLLYPEVQKKAQRELQRVLEANHLPDLRDEGDLPYITAVAKEVLRWNPLIPFGVPHASAKDDIYKGYYIPEGAMVIANQWALLQDETHYPEPDVFRPERFLDDKGGLNKDIRDPTHIIFGFGRRKCPGSEVAWSYLWLTIATILSAFEISEEIDEAGNIVKPHIEFPSGFFVYPTPFKCTIKPLSRTTELFIRDLELEEE